MKKNYYIIVWKDHNDVIHRDEMHYGGKWTAFFLFSDISVQIPHPRRRIETDGRLTFYSEMIYHKPFRTVLYIFTVKPK